MTTAAARKAKQNAKPSAKARAAAPAKPPMSVPSKRMGNILSLHAAKAEKAQKANSKLALTHQRLLTRAEHNAVIADQIFAASLAVIRCNTLADLRATLQTQVRDHLGVSATRLILAGGGSATTLPAADIDALFAGRSHVMLRSLSNAQDRELYGPKGKLIQSDCLLRLTFDGQTLGLLAFGSPDATYFHAGQSTHMAAYLAQVIGTCLARLAK